jgi:7,8-dihydro-6-hydroxymethylpterin-pyrophosphokinase
LQDYHFSHGDSSVICLRLALGIYGSTRFLKQAVKAQSNLDPHELLTFYRKLRLWGDRKPSVLVRLIDLDILFYDDLIEYTFLHRTLPGQSNSIVIVSTCHQYWAKQPRIKNGVMPAV